MKLADGKARTIQHMMCTTLLASRRHADVRAAVHGMLFGKLPEFFKDEAELRALWSAPDTRKKLLQGLAEKGFGARAAGRDAEDHRRREERPVRRAGPRRLCPAAAHPRGARRQGQGRDQHARSTASSRPFSTSCCRTTSASAWRNSTGKLTPLLRLKYHNSIADAVADLGKPEEIGKVFAGFQKYLYQANIVT